MAKIEKFEDIEAWKSAREVTKMIYAASSNGNFSRDFGLCNQIRRAAGSILSNIAEGLTWRKQGISTVFGDCKRLVR